MDCIFCEIVSGEAPASFVYRGPRVVAFLEPEPITPGHLLVVPKEHFPSLREIDEPLGAEMFSVARMLAESVRASGLECEGINLFYADGEAAFQEVFHSHLHVIPRFVGDGFRFETGNEATPSRAELDDQADMIRQAVESFD